MGQCKCAKETASEVVSNEAPVFKKRVLGRTSEPLAIGEENREIPRSVREQEQALEDLHCSLNRLEDAIAPILAQVTADSGGLDQDAQCSLGQCLVQNNAEIFRAIRRVNGLIDRCEL